MSAFDPTLCCPGCSAKFKLSEALKSHDLAAFGLMTSVIGADWRAMQPYLSCFRSAQGKAIRPERMFLILEELVEIWRTKTFTLNKKTMTVHPAVLRAALAEMAHKSDSMTGLKNHNYFKKILENMMQKFNAQESKNERVEIQRDKSGASRSEDAPEVSSETIAQTRELIDTMAAKLTPKERAAAVRKRAGDRPVAPANRVDREQAEELVRQELRSAGWPDEKIEAELKRRRRK